MNGAKCGRGTHTNSLVTAATSIYYQHTALRPKFEVYVPSTTKVAVESSRRITLSPVFVVDINRCGSGVNDAVSSDVESGGGDIQVAQFLEHNTREVER